MSRAQLSMIPMRNCQWSFGPMEGMFVLCCTFPQLRLFSAFIIGSKDGSDGTGPITESGNKMIFVSYNYRVSSVVMV